MELGVVDSPVVSEVEVKHVEDLGFGAELALLHEVLGGIAVHDELYCLVAVANAAAVADLFVFDEAEAPEE